MWTDTTRKQFARSSLRLPSDLTDAEWAVLEPLFPARSHRGRPPIWSYRQIVEALLYSAQPILGRIEAVFRKLHPLLFAHVAIDHIAGRDLDLLGLRAFHTCCASSPVRRQASL